MTHFDRQKRDRLRNDNGTAWRRDRVKSSPYKVDADGFDIPLQPRPKNK